MSDVNVEPTAEVIDAMAKSLIDTAREIERVAKQMRDRNDLTYASEAINTVSNLMNRLRLDLLITRPLREFNK